eukprot:gene6908-2635_t
MSPDKLVPSSRKLFGDRTNRKTYKVAMKRKAANEYGIPTIIQFNLDERRSKLIVTINPKTSTQTLIIVPTQYFSFFGQTTEFTESFAENFRSPRSLRPKPRVSREFRSAKISVNS